MARKERKRKPLRKRLRRNDKRTLTIRWRMPKLWKVWTQSNLIVGRSRRTNLKVNSKEVDDWNPSSNTSTQQQNLSQVNTIGCADEGLWIFALEDSQKRWYTVNWEDQSRSNPTEKWKTEEHELIDSGCFVMSSHRGLHHIFLW